MVTLTAPRSPSAGRSNTRPNPRPMARPDRSVVVTPAAPSPSPVPTVAIGPVVRHVLRRRRSVVVALVVVVALTAVGVGFGVGLASAELNGPPPAPAVYVVQPGDTLWTIAGHVAPQVATARAVAALAGAAGGAALTPGQRIVIPEQLH